MFLTFKKSCKGNILHIPMTQNQEYHVHFLVKIESKGRQEIHLQYFLRCLKTRINISNRCKKWNVKTNPVQIQVSKNKPAKFQRKSNLCIYLARPLQIVITDKKKLNSKSMYLLNIDTKKSRVFIDIDCVIHLPRVALFI